MSAQQFLKRLHRGGPYNFIQNLTAGPLGNKRYSAYFSQGETVKLPSGWDTEKANVYFGVNPTHTRREYYQASREPDIAALNCLYAEFDGKDYTDPSLDEIEAAYLILRADSKKSSATDKALRNEAVDVAKEIKYASNQAYYNELALKAILALPIQPSIIVFSGGGYHAYWLLDKPFIIAKDPGQHSAHINSYARDIQERWVKYVGGDSSASDLRRILRIPGTHNHKAKYAPNYPLVSFVKEDYACEYSLPDLVAVLPLPVVPVAHHAPQNQPVAHRTYEGESVIGAYNHSHSIVEVLKAHGYTQGRADKMNRPNTQSEGVKIFADTNTSFHRSTNDPLYNGNHAHTPFSVLVALDHSGDFRTALDEARTVTGIEKKRPQKLEPTFTQLLQAARQWVVTADFSTIIPAHLHSKSGYRTAETDRRAFAACLDVFEKYGKWSGPISQMQGHIASGLSKDSFRSSLNRWLETPFIKRITPPEAIEGGAYFYEINTCVLRAVGVFDKATLPRTKYASVFSEQKAEDAWQLRGSKVQREKALIKACGPAALVLIASLVVGERTHQAVAGARIHKKASTISRIVKRLEDYNMVLLERVGRENFITLLPDWQDRLKEVVPYMPTFGNKERREFNADTLVVEDCDRKLAKGIGDAAKLLSKREQAMCSLAIRMERDMSGIDFDTQSEKMRRLLRYDALRKTASTETKTAKTVEISMINRAKPTPWFESSQPETRRMLDIRQQLEDNETLIDAREQLRRAA